MSLPSLLIPLCLACSRPASPGDLALNQHPPFLRECPCFSALVSRASVRGQKHLHPWAWGQTTASQTVASHIWKKCAFRGCVLSPNALCTAGDRTYPKAEGPRRHTSQVQRVGSMSIWITFMAKVILTRWEDWNQKHPLQCQPLPLFCFLPNTYI